MAGAQARRGAQSTGTKQPLAEIVVLGSRRQADQIAGAAQILEAGELRASRVLSANEALRKLPGVLVREEEGLGLRPNIGIRGLNPTRSSKVLLLEDGLPLAFAPYGDNATYFHPSIERFERIEIIKNAGQIAYGPQTVGGIINYISAATPPQLEGRLTLRAGNRGLRIAQADVGDTTERSGTGWRVNLSRKQSDGARDNLHLDVTDLGLRLEQPISEMQSLHVRASHYREDSQVTYSGLTLAEYLRDPRANPFENDGFEATRSALAATHGWRLGNSTVLKSSVYLTRLSRDWWRQSSNSQQRPNDASDPRCGSMQNLLTTCGNEGRLRDYRTRGLETRLTTDWRRGDIAIGLDAGLRYHTEIQDRLQLNGDSPRARSAGSGINGGIRESNLREVWARAGYLATELRFDTLSIKPGMRFESIGYGRINRLSGSQGRSSLREWIPGVGVLWQAAPTLTFFGGVHRGFSPPRVEDAIGNNGVSVDLEAERSWNSELGFRYALSEIWRLELTAFDMDFANQVVPASLAGGVGATLTNGGSTRHRGFELLTTWQAQTGSWLPAGRLAATWLPVARFTGDRWALQTTGARVPIAGNRVPYAPRWSSTLTFDWKPIDAFAVQLEVTYVGAQFTDDLNTVALSVNGQRGRLGGHALLNATAEYSPVESMSVFVSAKNLGDRLYIADLSRGLLPGSGRQWQLGAEYRF